MDAKIYTNQSLLDMTKLKKSAIKIKKPENKEEQEKLVKDLVKFSEEAKEARKNQLLNSVFYANSEDSNNEKDDLSKYINKLKKQRQSVHSKLLTSNNTQRKTLQGQISFLDTQLQSLELKQLEIKRAEVGL